MDIKTATAIIKNDFDSYKKDFEAEKGKGKGAKTQPINHYNHFLKLVESHNCSDQDTLESFFLLILSDDFVKSENMPPTWKSLQAYSLAFKSMKTCLAVPEIKDYLLSVISEDQFNAIDAKCSEYQTSMRKQYEAIEHDKKSVNVSLNDDASSTTSISVDYEQLVEDLNKALDDTKLHAKKVEKCKTLLLVLAENENDAVKKAYIKSVLDSL
jgi:hypothetical protein